MNRRSLAAGVAVAALFASAPAAADAFTLGVAAGEVSSSSATLWAHAERAGSGTVEVATDRGFKHVAVGRRVAASRSHDNTVQARVTGLNPATSYFYRFQVGGKTSDTGRFSTAPAPKRARTIEFAYSGDADAQPLLGQTNPFWNNFEIYKRMAAEGNDFNINFGDTIYSDTEVGSQQEGAQFQPGAPTALTVSAKWAKYRQNLALRNLQLLRGSAVTYSHWDDHEFVNDFSVAENGSNLYKAGVRAFTDYAPVTWSSRDGLYRTFRWGKNLEVFFLDERSFRDAKASEGGTCNNPQSGSADLAPTAPQSTRSLFAALVPSLAQPAPQACVDRIRDPNRTFLGARQLARFKRDIERSDATFKVVMNETPIQQFYSLPYDRWEGYEADRQKVLTFLRDKVKNVVFLTTDTHANFIGDARLKTFEAGGPQDSGISEVVTGPVATKNFSLEIDDATGQKGSGAALRTAFLKPPPPNGIGMSCAVIDAFSYAHVQVTKTRLTVTPKDINGRPLKQPEGDACGPFVLNAK